MSTASAAAGIMGRPSLSIELDGFVLLLDAAVLQVEIAQAVAQFGQFVQISERILDLLFGLLRVPG